MEFSILVVTIYHATIYRWAELPNVWFLDSSLVPTSSSKVSKEFDRNRAVYEHGHSLDQACQPIHISCSAKGDGQNGRMTANASIALGSLAKHDSYESPGRLIPICRADSIVVEAETTVVPYQEAMISVTNASMCSAERLCALVIICLRKSIYSQSFPGPETVHTSYTRTPLVA